MARRSPISVPCAPSSKSEYHSKSVSKIDNGFLVRESHESDGNYTSREYFTKNPDRMAPQNAGAVGSEKLSGAIAECDK